MSSFLSTFTFVGMEQEAAQGGLLPGPSDQRHQAGGAQGDQVDQGGGEEGGQGCVQVRYDSTFSRDIWLLCVVN